MGGVGKTLTAKWYAHIYEQEYDHIIWIDCGEGSLLTSFKSLARDLKIEDRNELVKVQDYLRKCFDALTEFKCLWIYDNAENYKGEEGIINVLPKYKERFYCIITSRSREWGTEKIGFGKISDLELDIFCVEESLEFLNSLLLESIERSDSELKKLCLLMGNLPLALQLAVAALNTGKIKLHNYIDKTSSKDLGNIVEEKFDDYEKTINQCIKVSLDLILIQTNGKLAYEILMIFGYIRPDDVQLKLMEVIKCDSIRIKEAVDLLEKYSLITKTGRFWEIFQQGRNIYRLSRGNEMMGLLSIHRLLQQVIRYNGCETEKETLKKIFACEGFIEYKLIPFTKYADEELRKEFPEIRVQLIYQRQLNTLIGEGRFDEAVQLARFIDGELKTNATKFNVAICLSKNEQLEEGLVILKKLEEEEIKEIVTYSNMAFETWILELNTELSRDLIWGHLLIISLKMVNRRNIKEVLESRRSFEVSLSTDSFRTLIKLVHSDLIKSNYSLLKNHLYPSTIKLELGEESSKIELWECSLDLSFIDRLSPEELKLVNFSLTRNGHKVEKTNVNEFCDFHNINKLILCGDKMSIELSDEISMETLCLDKVKVLNWKEAKWNIQRLELGWIPLVDSRKMKFKEMYFSYSSLDISCLPPTIEKLDLVGAEVVCNGPIDLPNLKCLTLYGMSDSSFLPSFRSANLTYMHFNRIKEVNVDQLPRSVTHIKITNGSTIVVGGVRRVDKLILEDFSVNGVEELLGHFQADELVVNSGYHMSFTPKELIELTKIEINRIAVGRIRWDKEEFSVLSNHVDRKASYYLWEGGRGTGMEKEEFEELIADVEEWMVEISFLLLVQ